MDNLDKNVNEVIEDIKMKIDAINEISDDVDGDGKVRINEIKSKAISVLSIASDKVIETCKTISDYQELNECINVVKYKSKDLYDKTMKKIDEIKSSKVYKDTSKFIDQTVDQVKTETSSLIYSAKDNIDEFFANQQLDKTIDMAKLKIVDISEKGVDILKQWLKPGEDNK